MNTHHTINYIEFPADDLGLIKEFYTNAFGWKFTDYGPEYVAFTDRSLEGGFTAGSVAAEAGPLVILYSENLETTLGIVEKCGGTIARQIYAFPGGRRFHFIDPAGNQLAVWSDA